MFIAVALASPAMAQESENKRDEFFWMGEINKASTVMTVEQGIVPKSMAARIAQGVAYSIEQSSKPDGKRPKDYVQIERIITDAAGPDASRIHSGRSRQDIYATFHLAILRDMTLDLAESIQGA